jgi:hypothetical protein
MQSDPAVELLGRRSKPYMDVIRPYRAENRSLEG